MKLSDIKGERTFDVIADIIEPIASIAADPEASEMFQRKVLPPGKDAKEYLIERAKRALPKLLKGHKKDIITIMATIEGTSPGTYADSLNMAKLISDCIELLTDEAFIGLFTSAQIRRPSGSAPESTEAPTQ